MDQDPSGLTVSEKKRLRTEAYEKQIHNELGHRINTAVYKEQNRMKTAEERKRRAGTYISIALGAFAAMQLIRVILAYHNNEPHALKVQVPRSNCTEYVFHGWWSNIGECKFYSETLGDCVSVSEVYGDGWHLFCEGKETAQSRNGD